MCAFVHVHVHIGFLMADKHAKQCIYDSIFAIIYDLRCNIKPSALHYPFGMMSFPSLRYPAAHQDLASSSFLFLLSACLGAEAFPGMALSPPAKETELQTSFWGIFVLGTSPGRTLLHDNYRIY